MGYLLPFFTFTALKHIRKKTSPSQNWFSKYLQELQCLQERSLSTILKVITGRTGREGGVPLNEEDLYFWVIASDAYVVMYGLHFKHFVLNHQSGTSVTQEHAEASGKCVYGVVPHDTDE